MTQRHLLQHLPNNTIENKLDTIIHDTLTRQPTRQEHCVYELYLRELGRRGQQKHITRYKDLLSEMRYRIENHGYSDDNPKPECGA